MKKMLFILLALISFQSSQAIDALKFPNLVLYKELNQKGYYEIAYEGELLKLKTEIAKVFQDKDKSTISPTNTGPSIQWTGIEYPAVSPESYSLRLESVLKSKIIRISFISDSMGINIPTQYTSMRRRLADQLQLIIDRSLVVEYEELTEKFDVPYLNGGLPNEAALTAHLYFYTTQDPDSVISKMVKQFQAISVKGSSLTRASATLWQLDSLVMPELAMDKVFSILFRVQDLNQGSYKIEIFAAYYDPKDWQRDEQFNYSVRYYDLHYRMRWFLKPILF